MKFNEPIFSIPLYYNSEEIYCQKLEKKIKKNFEIEDNSYSKKQLKEFRHAFDTWHPGIHKYNDILGYAELFLDFHDILIYYYLNGDGRKKYNKQSLLGRCRCRGEIYPPSEHVFGGSFKKVNNKEIREAINKSFDRIEKHCKNWKAFVDLTHQREIIFYFDYVKYFKDKSGHFDLLDRIVSKKVENTIFLIIIKLIINTNA